MHTALSSSIVFASCVTHRAGENRKGAGTQRFPTWLDRANRTHKPPVDHLPFHAGTFRRRVSHLGHAVLFMVTAMDAPVDAGGAPVPARVGCDSSSGHQNQGGQSGEVSSMLGRERRTSGAGRRTGRANGSSTSQQSTTSFLTAAMLVYAPHAGITAAAGTRLAHKLILAV